jgi:hypothetical protein
LPLLSFLHRMEGSLSRREREDKPASAGIDRTKTEYIAKKYPVGFGILAV